MDLILLDTNVISELTRPKPDPRVLEWLDRFPPGVTWISSITVAEMKVGVGLLPEGKRRQALAAIVDRILEEFSVACAAFDGLAAEEFASIVVNRRRAGRTLSYPDAQIAAIARSAGLTLATRNTADFNDIENLAVIDPWAGGEA